MRAVAVVVVPAVVRQVVAVPQRRVQRALQVVAELALTALPQHRGLQESRQTRTRRRVL